MDQQPNLVDKVEGLESIRSKLHRFGSDINKFNPSKLTEVREIAFDVEDVIDNVNMVVEDTARQRWRKLSRSFFPSRSDRIYQLVKEQMEAIHKRTDSMGCAETPLTFERSDDFVAMANIPDDKKLCYLSLSGFPADVEISARQLIQIWLAGRILQPRESTAVKEEEGRGPMKEEEARRHIKWFLDNKFITKAVDGTSGTLKTFKIATDKLDDCICAAEKEKFIHVKLVVGPNHHEGHNSSCAAASSTDEGKANAAPAIPETPRLAIHNSSTRLSISNNLSSCGDLSKVRSLQIRCSSSSGHGNHFTSEASKRFLKSRKRELGNLWVLDLGGLELETVPEVIGKLTHLRYLRLRARKANKIPASICNLAYLQTIDMKETEHVKSMPVEIWKMKTSLRHLHIGGTTSLSAPRTANHYNALENLQTLSGVCPDKELKRLMVRAKFPSVTRLRLNAKTANKDVFLSVLDSLDHLYNLRSLTLRGAIENLPSDWNAFPPSLTKMTLLKTRIPVKSCVKTLQNLPNLRYLKLMEESMMGKDMECAACGFPALQVLRIESLKELQTWKLEKGAMELLKDLKVKQCESLQRVEAFRPSKELGDVLGESLKWPLISESNSMPLVFERPSKQYNLE